jgi:hypothetical protein
MLLRIASAVIVGSVLVGCGGSSAPGPATAPVASTTASPSPVGLSQKQQADAYLRIVAPANAALRTFDAKVTPDSSQSQVAAAAEPLADTFDHTGQALARAGFTGTAAADVRALLTALAAVVGDLRSVRSQDAFSVSQFTTAFNRDIATFGSAVALVRADLGLPPAS